VPAGAYLGVEHSITGRSWRAALDDERAALALAQRTGLPEIVARVLAARGIDAARAPAFLSPRLREQLPDPAHLKDMDAAAERIAFAIREGEKIAIFGDYDVDGATSAALLARFLAALGTMARLYIPDRQREGYGPNEAAMLALAREGMRVVITVDCGITAHGPLAAARAAGLDTIVVDHHAAEPALPPAFAVVNPNRLDETSPHRTLAAVGVAFLLAIAVNRALRKSGWFASRAEPDLMSLLDLVALGTVADVAPLTGLNRALVAQGLKVMAARANRGLAALADVAKLRAPPSAYHLGFVFGPRVNAGGRVGEAVLGARLLTTDDPEEARRIAARLDAMNRERQAIEAAVLQAALDQVGDQPGDLVVAAGEGWHAGVIGIVASRLKERFARPAIVIAIEDGIGKGSGRSPEGFDLGAAILAARAEGLLVNGGGHPRAAGLTVEAGRIADLRAFLAARIASHGPRDWVEPISVDGALTLRGATAALAETLARLGPFGVGNPNPRLAFPRVHVASAGVVGANHLRVTLFDPQGGRGQAIAFRAMGTPLGQALIGGGLPLHLLATLSVDRRGGRRGAEIVIEDAAPAG
jgi:single-stranded-DNA-specific exonuclease